MRRKFLIAIIIGVLGYVSACAPATAVPTTEVATAPQPPPPTETQAPVHLKVGTLSFLSHAPVHIAAAEGYFAEQGLDVELVDFGTSDREMLAALLAGQLDAGGMILSTSVMHAIEQGGNLKFVADRGFIDPTNSCPTDAWVARNDLLEAGTLDTPEGLMGLKMTSSIGNTLEYANDLMLQDAGLTPDDMTIVDMRDQVARLDAIANGTLDFYAVSEPWITRAINTGNAGVWKSFAEYIPNITVATIVFGPNLLEQDPDVGVRFMTAYLKAIDQFNQGKTDRNVEIIANFTQLDPAEIKELCWTRYRPDGKIDSQTFLEFEQWALDKEYIDGPLTFEQVWDPQYVDQANAILHK